jgi:hypothetical protein
VAGKEAPPEAFCFGTWLVTAYAVVFSKVRRVLVLFARCLGCSHLLYPIDGAFAHTELYRHGRGNEADSSNGTFVHHPMVVTSARAPSSPEHTRRSVPPPGCLTWSAWSARSYQRQGEATRQPYLPIDHYFPPTPRGPQLGIAQLHISRPMVSSARQFAWAHPVLQLLDRRGRTTILLARTVEVEAGPLQCRS